MADRKTFDDLDPVAALVVFDGLAARLPANDARRDPFFKPSLNPAYSPKPAPLAALGGFAARDVLSLGL